MANVVATPLYLNAVYTIAVGFITSCSSSDAPLLVNAYPSLTLESGLPTAPGAKIAISPVTAPSRVYCAAFVSGLDVISAMPEAYMNGMIMMEIPIGTSGQSCLPD
jgi:hypothetical protein